MVEASRKLAVAFERIEEQARIQVEVDTRQALSELGAVEAQASSLSADVQLDVNTEEALSKLAGVKETIDSISGTIAVDVDINAEAALRDLTALEASVSRLDARGISISVDAETNEAATQLALLDELASNLSGSVRVDADTTRAVVELEALQRSIPELSATIDVDLRVDEASAATELAVLDQLFDKLVAQVDVEVNEASALGAVAEIEAIASRVTSRIDVDVRLNDALEQLARVEAALSVLREQVPINFDLERLELLQAELAGVHAALEAIAAEDLDLHINVDTKGIPEAAAELAGLQAAITSLRDRVVIDVAPGETTGTIGELFEIRELAEFIDAYSDISIRVNTLGTTQAKADLQAIAALVEYLDRTAVRLNVALRGLAPTLQGLAALEAATQPIDGTIYIDIRALAGDALATLGVLNSQFRALPNRVDTRVGISGAASSLAELGALNAGFRAVPERVATQAELNGVPKYIADAAAATAAATAIPNRVDTTVGIDRTLGSRARGVGRLTSLLGGGISGLLRSAFSGLSSAFSSLTSLGGTASSSLTGVSQAATGMVKPVADASGQVSEMAGQLGKIGGTAGSAAGGAGGGGAGAAAAAVQALGSIKDAAQKVFQVLLKFNLIGGALVTLAALIGYLIPLATGLIGAAAGLLLFGAAATVATAGVGALVLLLPETIDQFKSLFNGLKTLADTTLRPALEPILVLLKGEFAQAIGTFAAAVERLAPVFLSAFGPVFDQIQQFITLILEVAGPLTQAVGEGFAQVFDTLVDLFAATDLTVATEATAELFDLLDALIRILGEVGLNFPLTEILEELTGLVEQATPKFIEIVSTFGEFLPGIVGGLGSLFEPLGDFAITIGQAVAALGPELDTLFDAITALALPFVNPKILDALVQNVVPQLVTFLERLAPVFERVLGTWVRLMEQIGSDPDSWLALEALIYGVAYAVEFFIKVIATVVNAWGALVDLFVLSVNVFAGFIDGLLSQLETLLTGIFGFLQQFRTGLATIAAVARRAADLGLPGAATVADQAEGMVQAFDGLKNASIGGIREARRINESIRAGIISWINSTRAIYANSRALEDYARDGDRASRTSIRIAEAQKRIAEVMGFAATVFEPISEAAGNVFDVSWDDILYQEADEVEKAARRTGGALANYFAVEGEEAVETQDFYKKALDANSISEYMDRENLDIDRAIKSLVTNLRLKTENIRRLNFLVALGFDDTARELASLFDDPRMLSKAIDDLVGQGIGRLQQAEGDIESAYGGLAAEFATLGPVLAEALGVAEEEAKSAVDDTTDNIFEAIQNAQKEIALEGSNARRITALYNAGFTETATQLFEAFEGDPQALAAALDQLDASGRSGLQQVENGFRSGVEASVAAYAALPPALKEIAGLAEEAVKGGTEKVIKSTEEIFQTYIDSVNKNIDRVNVLAVIARNKPGLTNFLSTLLEQDPLAFDQVTDDLIAGGQAALDDLDRRLGVLVKRQQDGLAENLVLGDLANNPAFVQAFANIYGLSIEEAQEYLDSLTQELDFFVDTAVGAVQRFALAYGNPNVPVGSPVRSGWVPQAAKDAEQTADDVESATRRVFEELIPEFELVGEDVGIALGDGIEKGLGGEDLANLTAILSTAFEDIDYDRVNLWGETLGISYYSGFTKNAGENGPRIQELTRGFLNNEDLTQVARSAGNAIGLNFISRIIGTIEDTSPNVVDAVADIFGAIGLGEPADLAKSVGELLGIQFFVGLGFQLIIGAGSIVGTLSTLWLEVGRDTGSIANLVGIAVGTRFGEGIELGIRLSLQAVKSEVLELLAVIITTVNQILDINSPSGVGMSMGEFFGLGLALGIRNQIEQVRAASQELTGAISTEVDAADPVGNLADDLATVAAQTRAQIAQQQLAAQLNQQPTTVTSQATIVSDAQLSVQDGTITAEAQQSAATQALLVQILDQLRAGRQRPLIENYNVEAAEAGPQSPQQLARDIDFVANTVGSN